MSDRPLQGVTVLDLSRVLSGPYATQQLSDLGARVIKVEHPSAGDDTRNFGPPFVNGESSYFMSVNRAKQSIAIDLKKPQGLQILKELAQSADVIVENFRPGKLATLGLDLDALRAKKPRLVTCSISGFGGTGDTEYVQRGGYDAVTQGVAGLMAITGAPDGPPHRLGVAIADLSAGLFATQGILGALFRSLRSGTGGHIDISMQDTVCSLLSYQAGYFFATGESPPRMGNAHPSICPYETVETKDGPLILAIGNDQQFARLAKLLDQSSLAEDERFSSNRERVRNRPALMEILGPVFEIHTRAHWEQRLGGAALPCGPVLSVKEALEHPQLEARGSILDHQHPTAGPVRTVRSPVRLDPEPPPASTAPPTLGEHTYEILRKDLGWSDEAIEALAAEHVIRAPRP